MPFYDRQRIFLVNQVRGRSFVYIRYELVLPKEQAVEKVFVVALVFERVC